MKKVFNTLSAILLATACLTPGLAWADGNTSVALEQSGSLKASDANDVHSALVEVQFVGENADKVTDVVLQDAPNGALSSAVFDAATKKATIAISSGDEALKLTDSSLGTLNVIAQGASAETPVSVDAKLVFLQYIDSDDSTADTTDVDMASSTAVRLTSTESTTPASVGSGPYPGNLGTAIEGTGNGGGAGGNGLGNGIGGNGNGTGSGGGSNGNTATADYRANGVVTQAGQGTAGSTGLVKTGDVLAICGIALGAAAIAVFVAMTISRKKKSSSK